MNEKLAEFLAMGGYAGYVWSAFGITLFVMAMLAGLAWRADRNSLERIRRREENR